MTIATFKKILGITIICLLMGVKSLSVAGESEFGENELKAAFVYNFAKFVTWPDSSFPHADTPLNLCIVGNDPLARMLISLEGAGAQGRKITVSQLKEYAQANNCHILFIGASERGRLAEILAAVRRSNILTIAEMEGFCQSGGIINLVTKDKKVRFEINVDAAQRSGLQLSSQLLTLAKIVKEK